jgi:hypothetical protein
VISRHLVIAFDTVSPGLCGLLIKEEVFNCGIAIAQASLREKNEEQDVFCDVLDRAYDDFAERTVRLILVISMLRLPDVFR